MMLRTLFSYIPNTAEVLFGLTKGVQEYLNKVKTKDLRSRKKPNTKDISKTTKYLQGLKKNSYKRR